MILSRFFKISKLFLRCLAELELPCSFSCLPSGIQRYLDELKQNPNGICVFWMKRKFLILRWNRSEIQRFLALSKGFSAWVERLVQFIFKIAFKSQVCHREFMVISLDAVMLPLQLPFPWKRLIIWILSNSGRWFRRRSLVHFYWCFSDGF